MIIQSKRVWTANNFHSLQVEITDGKINGIYPYGTKK